MFKKSKLYLIILVLMVSAFPASKVLFQEAGGNIDQPAGEINRSAVQTAGQDAQTAGREPAAQSQIVSTVSSDKIMTVHFLDVGQADSIFIDLGPYEILVDAGNNGDGPRIAEYIKPYVDGNLELIVATHAHEDHIGGLDIVLEAYQTGQIIYSEETSSSDTFQDFYNAAVSEPDCKLTGDSDMTFYLADGVQFKILEMGDGNKDPNKNSVVSMVDYNDVEILLMGDLDSPQEKNNLTKLTDIDVLKVGHHGSKTASSQEFLDVVKPEAAIISAGVDNRYKLPNQEVIERLLSMNSAVYGTFRSGNIIMTTDGVQYQINAKIQLTPNDAGAPSVRSN